MRRPPATVVAGAVVLTAYVSTLAPSVTKWDSGEFLAAIHSLGIPHPPATPLYVLVARVWAMIPSPLEFAARVNLFSAACAAAAVTLLGILLARWTGDRIAGAAATLCAGGTATLWLSATETEVYAAALLVSVVLLWLASGQSGARRVALVGYVAGLGWATHLTALLTLPAAALLLTNRDGWRAGIEKLTRRPGLLLVAAGVGMSPVLYLIIRAAFDPAINQGNPETWRALWDVVTRAQYAPPGLWPRRAPPWIQLGNWFEYADWQFALGLSPAPPPSSARTPLTIVFAALGVYGMLEHRRIDRRSWRAIVTTFVVATLGVIVYLNLRAGPSFGAGVLPAGTPHEPRERDYFFVLSFVIWAAWAGFGVVRAARTAARSFSRAPVIAAALGVAALPLAVNWRVAWVERARGSVAVHADALHMLTALPSGAVFLAIGDNDTYPLWYLQQVEQVRRDVTVVTIPLLGAEWYRAELARRWDLTESARVTRWRGLGEAVCSVVARAAAAGRPVVLTPQLSNRKLTEEC